MSTMKNDIRMDSKALLSTLWIFVTLNYLYCDIMGLMDHDLLRQYLTGTVNGMKFTDGFLLGAAILMEIPMAMVLLSRLLKYRANRWSNIIPGTSFIVWYAWKWQDSELK